MWPTVTDGLAWSVGLSVKIVSPAKIAELIKIHLGCGFKEECIRWGSTPPPEGPILRGKGRPFEKYRNYYVRRQ